MNNELLTDVENTLNAARCEIISLRSLIDELSPKAKAFDLLCRIMLPAGAGTMSIDALWLVQNAISQMDDAKKKEVDPVQYYRVYFYSTMQEGKCYLTNSNEIARRFTFEEACEEVSRHPNIYHMECIEDVASQET